MLKQAKGSRPAKSAEQKFQWPFFSMKFQQIKLQVPKSPSSGRLPQALLYKLLTLT